MQSLKKKARRVLPVGVILVSVAMAVAACSSSAPATSSTSASSGSAAPSSAGLTAAQALITKYSADPGFTSPGPAVDAKKVAGKTLFSLPANSQVPFVQAVDGVMGTYAKALGMNYVNYPNQQQQAQWVQGMQQAITTKANAIDLISGIPPEQLQPQIAQATDAKIPTIDVNERDRSQTAPSYVAAYVYAPFLLSGRLMSAWAVTQTKGNADILLLTSNADVSSKAVQNGVMSELKATCPACKVKTANVNPVDWATKIPSTVEGAISGDPNINYILPVYDAMADYASTGVTAAGKVGSIHIATFNGTPSTVNEIRTGSTITMDVGENSSFVAAATIDQAMRLMLGMKPGNEEVVPKIITKANASDFGVPAVSGKGYGDAFISGFAKTWGVSPSVLSGN